MPPYSDQVQIYDAIRHQAGPVLDALATNPDLRDRTLRRFERDEPPPYESSTESEEFDDVNDFFAPQLQPEANPQPAGEEMPEALKAIMEKAISDDEVEKLVQRLSPILCPIYSYHAEAELEMERLSDPRFWTTRIFRDRDGNQRAGVVVRRNVKRRWEKLGVWNSRWGFPGRKVETRDKARQWQWWWKQQAPHSPGPTSLKTDDEVEELVKRYAEELIRRALLLRRNLRRGESVPVIPQSHLDPDTTVSQAESFLISRPWVIFEIEIAEEELRYRRLPLDQRRQYPYSAQDQVITWWKERGDWRQAFDRENRVTSWKWRHESPSPEPEDLAPFENRHSLLEPADIEFTPSEIDDLETINLPPSEQPNGYWTIEDFEPKPHFPGQTVDLDARAERREQELRRYYPHLYSQDNTHSSVRKNRVSLFGPLDPLSADKRMGVSTEERKNDSQDSREDLPGPEQAPPKPPPQAARRRGRAQPRVQAGSMPNEDKPKPQLRRSARISAMKRAAESLASKQEAEGPTNKRRKLRTTSDRQSSTASATAAEPTTRSTRRAGPSRAAPARSPPPPSPPRKTQNRAQYKRGRTTDGSSAKGQGVGRSRSAVTKKTNNKKQEPAKPSATAGAAQQRSTRGRFKK